VVNPRPEKVAVVDEVREQFAAADAVLLTEYRGLSVAALAELRRALRPSGAEYKVYKNTLVRFAARAHGVEGADELLTGPTAIAFVKGDAAAAAKVLRDYSRTNPALITKGGVLGTTVLDAAQVTALADLPPREVLLARLAGAFQAPMTKMAGLLQALPRNFAYGLKALIDEGGPQGAQSSPTTDAAPDEAPAAESTPTTDAAPDEAPAADTDTQES
jgi:large subunit ribosomal protein L10